MNKEQNGNNIGLRKKAAAAKEGAHLVQMNSSFRMEYFLIFR